MSTDHYKIHTDTTKAMRHWCFTLNNYTDEEVDQFKLMGCRFIVFGFEIGEECGTPHLQGYVEFEGTKRLSAMKKINARAHWGIRYYTRQRARDYCKKGEQTKVEWDALHETGPNWGKNAIIFTKGDWESGGSGTRNDLLAVKEAIQNGASCLISWIQTSKFTACTETPSRSIKPALINGTLENSDKLAFTSTGGSVELAKHVRYSMNTQTHFEFKVGLNPTSSCLMGMKAKTSSYSMTSMATFLPKHSYVYSTAIRLHLT